MDSEILDQLTDLGRDVNSEFPKPKRGRKKKADTKINELEDNDVKDKRERLVACILSGNSKMYLEKNTQRSKLIRWTVMMSIHFYIDTNLFLVLK